MADIDTPIKEAPPKIEPAKPEVEQPPMKSLLMHNADNVSFQEVWRVLSSVFNMDTQTIRSYAMRAHENGKVELLKGSQDVVETKHAACVAAAHNEGCPQLPFSVENV